MGTIVNLIMRAVGLGKAVDALDGETSKTYTGAVGTMFLGLATLAGGLAGLASQLVDTHGGAAYLAFLKGINQNSQAGLVVAGAGMIATGWKAIGLRHALAKAQAEPKQDSKAGGTTPDAPKAQ